MTTVNKINGAIAGVRGAPLATIESYSRVLRREGILPATKRGGGAALLAPVHAAYMLCAVMRGSPTNAAENAREVGGLIAYEGTLTEPLLHRQLQVLGWPDGITFAQAIGWFIERIIDGTFDDFVHENKEIIQYDKRGIEIWVDRYWTIAKLRWLPSLTVVDAYAIGWRESFGSDLPRHMLRVDDGFQEPMEIRFLSPLLHKMKLTYGVSREQNWEASRKFSELKDQRSKGDLHGSEFVTLKTLAALAEVFKVKSSKS